MLVKKAQEDQNKFRFLAEQIKGIKAVIETNYGEIELEFFPEKAPLHCFNFITRAESGFYDNTQFHRVIPNFMIQGGDPNTRTGNVATYGSGGPIIHIPHEFNDISHGPGILSMARTSNLNDGAGSQFFIMHGSSPQLDGQYTVFGRVTQGMDVVDKIAAVPRTDNDRPIKAVYIKRIKVFR
ncbi:MAG TPA: peptidylprolyl isomerase [Calditrichaeota bacterium]|nr:peptidylprolyl isomerase [Calditrichota bacterium]